MAAVVTQSVAESKDAICDAGGHCFDVHPRWTHAIWASVLGALVLAACVSLVIVKWRQRRYLTALQGEKHAMQHTVHLEDQIYDPVPRYSPAHNELVSMPLNRQAENCADLGAGLSVPKTAACRAHPGHSPPPYTIPTRLDGAIRITPLARV